MFPGFIQLQRRISGISRFLHDVDNLRSIPVSASRAGAVLGLYPTVVSVAARCLAVWRNGHPIKEEIPMKLVRMAIAIVISGAALQAAAQGSSPSSPSPSNPADFAAISAADAKRHQDAVAAIAQVF